MAIYCVTAIRGKHATLSNHGEKVRMWCESQDAAGKARKHFKGLEMDIRSTTVHEHPKGKSELIDFLNIITND